MAEKVLINFMTVAQLQWRELVVSTKVWGLLVYILYHTGSWQNPYLVKCLLVCELNDPILFSIVEIQMSTSENCSSTMLSNVTFFSVAIVMQSLNYSLNYVCLSKSNLAQ